MASQRTRDPWNTHSDLACIAQLGKGAYGSVYHAFNEELEESFAVKVISIGQFIRRYTPHCGSNVEVASKIWREIKALLTLRGRRNVVEYFDYWIEGPLAEEFTRLMANPLDGVQREIGSSSGFPLYDEDKTKVFIKMEYCHNNLKAWMKEKCIQTDLRIEKSSILLQMAVGLCQIHGANIIHRDLNPCNVLLKRMPDGEILIKIADFGLSKDTYSDASSLPVGYVNYRSPEVVNSAKYGLPSDIFSLGLIFFELLREERFSQQAVFESFQNGDITALRKLRGPVKYQELIPRMIHPDPDKRPCSTQVLMGLTQFERNERKGTKTKWIIPLLILSVLLFAILEFLPNSDNEVHFNQTEPVSVSEVTCGPYQVHLYNATRCLGSLIQVVTVTEPHVPVPFNDSEVSSVWIPRIENCTEVTLSGYDWTNITLIPGGLVEIPDWRNYSVPCGECFTYKPFDVLHALGCNKVE